MTELVTRSIKIYSQVIGNNNLIVLKELKKTLLLTDLLSFTQI